MTLLPAASLPRGGPCADLPEIGASMLERLHGHSPAISRVLKHEPGLVFVPPSFQPNETTVRAGTNILAWTDDGLRPQNDGPLFVMSEVPYEICASIPKALRI